MKKRREILESFLNDAETDIGPVNNPTICIKFPLVLKSKEKYLEDLEVKWTDGLEVFQLQEDLKTFFLPISNSIMIVSGLTTSYSVIRSWWVVLTEVCPPLISFVFMYMFLCPFFTFLPFCIFFFLPFLSFIFCLLLFSLFFFLTFLSLPKPRVQIGLTKVGGLTTSSSTKNVP